MRTAIVITITIAIFSAPLVAQEKKPVPKDSVRVSIPGCTKGYVFTAGPRTPDEPGSVDIADGTHLRLNGPKKLMGEIKAHEGSRIEITGLMKRGEYGPEGISLGGGLRIAPGPATPGGSSVSSTPGGGGQIPIDVEAWRQIPGGCPLR
jgi:hypothetical protein